MGNNMIRTGFDVHWNVCGYYIHRWFLTVHDDYGHRVEKRSDRYRHGFWLFNVFTQQPPRAVLSGVMIVDFDDGRRLLTRTYGTAQRGVHWKNISIENNVHVENRFRKRVGPEVSGVSRRILVGEVCIARPLKFQENKKFPWSIKVTPNKNVYSRTYMNRNLK